MPGIALLALWLAIMPAARAEPPPIVQREITYLIRYIGDSRCEFKRNGTWSNAESAEAHVRGKYDFLLTLGQIDSTQDFIDKAATKSSMSGQPYEVKCSGDAPMPTSLWLSRGLAHYRASQR